VSAAEQPPPKAGAPAAVGIDVGGTKLAAVRLGAGGEVAAESQRPSPLTAPDLVAAVRAVVAELGGGSPCAVGVGVPGLVGSDGTLLFAPNLPGAAGAQLGAALSGDGHRVWIGNDATAACWAEHRSGAGKGYKHMLMVTLGTGIGGGLVTGGTLVEGANSFAGEFGHMVVDPEGPVCGCGRRGCWERFASGTGLAALAREAAGAGHAPGLLRVAGGNASALRGDDVTAAAAAGDSDALAVMERFAWWVAAGLANLANAFDPEAIVVGGGLVDAGELLLGPVRRVFVEAVAAGSLRREVAIVAAHLGGRAGAVGAALLAETAGREPGG
jgi:glucokinase